MPSKIPTGFAPATLSAIPEGFAPVVSPESSPSYLDQVGAVGKGMLAAAGTGIQNLYNNIRAGSRALGKPIAAAAGLEIPSSLPASHVNFYNALNVPAYARKGFPHLLESMTQYAPAMFMPEAAPEEITPSAFGMMPKIKAAATNVLNDLAPRIQNIAHQAVVGGLLSNNPQQGAKNFGVTQAVIEGANPLLRLGMAPLHAAAELVNPSKAAKIFTNGLQKVYQTVAGQVKSAYSMMNPYKDQLIENAHNLIDPESYKYFPGTIKRKVNTFLNEPTIQNAHELQSDMFTTAKKINPQTFDDLDKVNALQDSREPLLNAIVTNLHSYDPAAALSYNRGRYLVRNELSPLTPTSYFHNLANGEIEGTNPHEIVQQYHKAFPIKSSVPNNYLSENVPKLDQKIGMGHFAQYILPMGAAGLASHLGDLSGLGSGMTLAGSGAFARWAELPIVKNMLQNEALHQGLGKLGKAGRKISKIAGPLIAGENTNSLNNMNQNNNSNSQ